MQTFMPSGAVALRDELRRNLAEEIAGLKFGEYHASLTWR